ncbi:hypothetical protein [Portibacter marinus]|uniref:hypothetical protein n=1 Tax=Portibacter marinus TaxID=2898660 RepID=UPI001F2132B9|nr:hypothetical protein [Portibacter marinus]
MFKLLTKKINFMKILRVFYALVFIILLSNCSKDVVNLDDLDEYKQTVQLIENTGVQLSEADKYKIKKAIQSGESWATSSYTRNLTKEEIEKYSPSSTTYRTNHCNCVGGAEILSAQIPNLFELTMADNPTVTGYNVVDDCNHSDNFPRFTADFEIGYTTHDKSIRIFIVDTSGGTLEEAFIAVDNDCYDFAYSTGNLCGMGNVTVCGVIYPT